MLFYTYKEIHNADTPYEVKNCDIATFQYCKNKTNNTDFTLIKPHVTSIIDLTQTNKELWHNINPSTRSNINRAKREHIFIEKNKHYNQAYKLYKLLLKKKKYASVHGLLTIFGIGSVSKKTMNQYATLFTARIDQEIIAMMAFLESKTSIHAWLGGSKRLNVNKDKAKKISNANRLIIWEAIQYAKNKGMQEFDLGGIFSDKEIQQDPQKKGIREFKRQFGGTKVTRYQYQKIYSPTLKILYKLYDKI